MFLRRLVPSFICRAIEDETRTEVVADATARLLHWQEYPVYEMNGAEKEAWTRAMEIARSVIRLQGPCSVS
jgi:hypothetical protein